MEAVPRTKEPAVSRPRFNEHAPATRVRGPSRHAVLDYVDVEARPERPGNRLAAGPGHDLLDAEVRSLRMFPVEQRQNEPDLVGHLRKRGPRRHGSSPPKQEYKDLMYS